MMIVKCNSVPTLVILSLCILLNATLWFYIGGSIEVVRLLATAFSGVMYYVVVMSLVNTIRPSRSWDRRRRRVPSLEAI